MSKRTITSSSPNRASARVARELRLADAGRAEEEEAAVGTARVGQPGAGAPDRLRDRLDRLVLADDPLMQAAARASSAARAPRVSWETGMPVLRETISAMSSAS